VADLDLSRARGITIRQPWASAFTRGPIHLRKSVENRPRGWPTGTYLIHAGKAWDGSGSHDPQIVAWNGGIAVPDMARFPLGAVLGVARLVDCHRAAGCCQPWGWTWPGERNYHLVLTDIVSLAEAVPCRDALGAWTPSDVVLAAVVAQLTAAETARA
jgi:hypothetical protein